MNTPHLTDDQTKLVADLLFEEMMVQAEQQNWDAIDAAWNTLKALRKSYHPTDLADWRLEGVTNVQRGLRVDGAA